MTTTILVNGEVSEGLIPVTDSSVLRGDGCFEVLKAYAGQPFALDEHLDRLSMSASALRIPLPSREALARWIGMIADELGDGAVRVVVTRGPSVPGLAGEPNVIVFGHVWERGDETARLLPVVAPWHAAGADWDLAGAKVISYAPNLSSTRRAREHGFDDALLVTVDDVVLEGPTFSVAWVVDGRLETPALSLGILDSITRRMVLGLTADAGVEIVEGRWDLARLDSAEEVMAWSTIREVQAVVAVGDRQWAPGEVTRRLAASFAELTG